MTSNYFPEHQGGIESVARELASGYRRSGHEVRFAAAEVLEAPHEVGVDDRALAAWNVTERHFGFPYPLPSPADLWRLRRDVAWADAVHVNDCLYAINLACFLHARSLRRPILVTQHVPRVPYRNPLVRTLQAVAYATLGHSLLSGADQVVFVGEAVRRAYSHLRFRRQPRVIENAIDIDLFTPATPRERLQLRAGLAIDRDRPVLLFVGRLVAKKGLARVRAIARAIPDATVLLAGRPGDVDPGTWDESNVRVLGPVPQRRLRDLYCAADVLLLPSVGEGLPVSVQEAMACGTPALVSAETAASFAGLEVFVLDHDLPASVRGALAGGSALRSRVLEAARDRWAPEKMLKRYEQLLVTIVAESTGREQPSSDVKGQTEAADLVVAGGSDVIEAHDERASKRNRETDPAGHGFVRLNRAR